MRVGWFEFALSGKRHRLEATRLLEPGVGEDVSLFFTDATTGKESYSVGGRYLDPADGLYVLDFNRCYNPACAYSDHCCPIPRPPPTGSESPSGPARWTRTTH